MFLVENMGKSLLTINLIIDIIGCPSKLGDYSFDYLIKREESPNTLSWLELMSLSAMDKRVGGNTPRLRSQRCEQRRHGSKELRYPITDKLPINDRSAGRKWQVKRLNPYRVQEQTSDRKRITMCTQKVLISYLLREK